MCYTSYMYFLTVTLDAGLTKVLLMPGSNLFDRPKARFKSRPTSWMASQSLCDLHFTSPRLCDISCTRKEAFEILLWRCPLCCQGDVPFENCDCFQHYLSLCDYPYRLSHNLEPLGPKGSGPVDKLESANTSA